MWNPKKRWPPMSKEDRFMSHVMPEPNSGCWLWTGAILHDGYGACNIRLYGDGRAHRAAFLAAGGTIPSGKEIDHVCKVRCCVNPQHLRVVTHAENMATRVLPPDRHLHGRKTHCKRGHPFSGNNLRVSYYRGYRHRSCRTCERERGAA